MQETVLNVKDFGAIGDRTSDDTQAFKSAVEKAVITKLPVYIPGGEYRLTDTIELKSVTMYGYISGAWCADDDRLPKLICDQRHGPMFQLLSGSIAGVALHYEFEGSNTGECGPLPPAIVSKWAGGRVSNLKIYGAWEGIVMDDMAPESYNAGRFNAENIFMHDIHKTGVYMGGTLDVDVLNNIEVWSPDSKVFAREGVGFHFKKNDGVRINNCFVLNAFIGFLFDETHENHQYNGGTMGWMVNCNVDFSDIGILVRGISKDDIAPEFAGHYYATQISVTGGSFWCHRTAVLVESGDANVAIANADLRSNGGDCVIISAGLNVNISSCKIDRVFPSINPEFTNPCMRINGGKRVTITGNNMDCTYDTLIIEEGVHSLIINGNNISYGTTGIIDPELVMEYKLGLLEKISVPACHKKGIVDSAKSCKYKVIANNIELPRIV